MEDYSSLPKEVGFYLMKDNDLNIYHCRHYESDFDSAESYCLWFIFNGIECLYRYFTESNTYWLRQYFMSKDFIKNNDTTLLNNFDSFKCIKSSEDTNFNYRIFVDKKFNNITKLIDYIKIEQGIKFLNECNISLYFKNKI
jgi:hypothetical protein